MVSFHSLSVYLPSNSIGILQNLEIVEKLWQYAAAAADLRTLRQATFTLNMEVAADTQYSKIIQSTYGLKNIFKWEDTLWVGVLCAFIYFIMLKSYHSKPDWDKEAFCLYPFHGS